MARYHGPGSGLDSAHAMTLDAAGNVYVTGLSSGVGTYTDYATVKYCSDGTELWVARYHGPSNGDDYALAMALDADGNVFVTGTSCNPPGCISSDFATIKYAQQ